MDDFEDIKAKIERLRPADEAKLRAWLADRHHETWDKHISDDLAAGRLDDLIAEVRADIAAGHGRDV